MGVTDEPLANSVNTEDGGDDGSERARTARRPPPNLAAYAG